MASPSTAHVPFSPSADPLREDPGRVETATVEAEVRFEEADPSRRSNATSSASPTPSPAGGERIAGTPIVEKEEVQEELHNLDRVKMALEGGARLSSPEQSVLRLANIRLSGSSAVRPSFLARVCRPYVDEDLAFSRLYRLLHSSSGRLDFPPPGAPTTLQGILQLTSSLATDLQRLDLYNGIDASILPAITPSSPQTAMQDVDVLLQLRESPRFFLKSSTDVGNGEGSVSVQGRIRNLFGGAEKLEGSYEMGTRTRGAMNATFTTPVLASPDHAFILSGYLSNRDKNYYASHYEALQGLKASLTANASSSSQHELAWELSWRQMNRLSPYASASIRKMARGGGHSVKSSLVHTFVSDTRDAVTPSQGGSEGRLVKSITEMAGLGGDAQFVKWEGQWGINRSLEAKLGSGWAWAAGARAGLMRPLSLPSFASGGVSSATAASDVKLPFADRFQLGGPTCVRMFKMNSLGPKDGRDSLGGTAFYSLGASLFSPLPLKPHWPLKMHAFLNGGQLSSLPLSLSSANPSTLLQETLLRPSTSAGVGLMYEQGALRLELNAGMPLSAARGDGSRKGVQLGVGISFLG